MALVIIPEFKSLISNSKKWCGFLMAPLSETFTIYIDAFKTANFNVYLNDNLIISNYFETTNESPLPSSAYFKSNEIDFI